MFKSKWGKVGQTFSCFYNPHQPDVVILERTTPFAAVNAVVWPCLLLLIGASLWLGLCLGCWSLGNDVANKEECTRGSTNIRIQWHRHDEDAIPSYLLTCVRVTFHYASMSRTWWQTGLIYLDVTKETCSQLISDRDSGRSTIGSRPTSVVECHPHWPKLVKQQRLTENLSMSHTCYMQNSVHHAA